MKSSLRLTLMDFCQECGMSEDEIQFFLNEGWIKPENEVAALFDQEDLARVLFIHDLLEDMEVNKEAVPIILDLVDQIHFLRSQILKHQT